MTAPSQHISTAAQQFNWLLNQFAAKTPLVADAIAVSSDGLLIAMSDGIERTEADRMAAVTSAMISLANGASAGRRLGAPNRGIIDLGGGYLLIIAINPGATLGVFAPQSANPGPLAHGMRTFPKPANEVLTPGRI